ncbi:hypothetical protein WR25_06173 [Diploscapter pachys]|uniref:Uncharacterized protein n=1 Tax=Diploscapter pachys TaxID=2018661 RepID=A0A2A2LSM3_9BILA|nr:hypothetical protein WR25_06173 [Diploscapter pachys]
MGGSANTSTRIAAGGNGASTMTAVEEAPAGGSSTMTAGSQGPFCCPPKSLDIDSIATIVNQTACPAQTYHLNKLAQQLISIQ